MSSTKPLLKHVREQLAEMTKKVCDDCTCEQRSQPYRCCHGWACDLAIAYADWKWGEQLHHTGHPELPLMGPSGCTAPPHLRPACAGHICDGNADDMPESYWDLKQLAAELDAKL
ncbi:MAG: hypothetical protein VXX11_03775 [Planctomycetota bacterium]|nr:hypothetical protein [Planctomycetota bacterium]